MAAFYEQLEKADPAERSKHIAESFTETYPDLISADPDAWRGKFRKMAGSPFAFYRGSAALFYRDLSTDDDPDAQSGNEKNVYEIHSKSTAPALDGKTHYNEW